MSEITLNNDYRQALAAIKQRIQTSQIRAVLAVNVKLLGLYWDIAASWRRGSANGRGARRWWSTWRRTCRLPIQA